MTKQWAQGLGRVIRSRRQALGLSQAALAKRAGISQPYLSQVEAGARGEVRTGIARRLADALGMSVVELLENEVQIMPGRGPTEFWLYQMRERLDWTWPDFCRDVREGRLLPPGTNRRA